MATLSPSDPSLMADAPSGRRYTELAQHLHWVTAALAFAVIPVAWVMTHLPEHSPLQGQLFDLHKSLGLTIWLFVVTRLVWRATHPAPALGPHTPAWIEWGSKASHWLIYMLFFLMPISGFTTSSAGGYGGKFWGIPLPNLPHDPGLAKLAGTAHVLSSYAVYALIGLHIVATVWHVAFRRDGLLERMIPAQTHADPAG